MYIFVMVSQIMMENKPWQADTHFFFSETDDTFMK